jgi:hypothetical protein
MRPFIGELAVGFNQHDFPAVPRDFGAVEFIAAPRGFLMDRFEISGHGGHRFSVRAKTDELRMMPVAPGFAAQNFLRQQRLAPERDESFGIEIFRMEGPQAHFGIAANSAGVREL